MPSGEDYVDTPFMSVKTGIITLYFTASCTPKQAAVLYLEWPQCGPSGLLPYEISHKASFNCRGLHVQKDLRPVPTLQSCEESLESHLYLSTYAKQNGG